MRLRLILSFTLIVFVTLASIAIIARNSTAEEISRFMGGGGVFGLDSITARLESHYQTNHTWGGVDSILKTPGIHGQENAGGGGNPRSKFQLADLDGYVVFNTISGETGTLLSNQEIEQAIVLEVDQEPVGYLYAEGGFKISQEAQDMLVKRINDAALSAALIAGGISLVLALVLATQLLHPIRDLTKAASHLAQGELSYRAPVRGKDELSVLAKTFNHMASSLEKAETSRRDLTADIAHELRTPLAVQRAHLEALEDGIYDLTLENLVAIKEQNYTLERLVDDLRTLALADAGQLRMVCTPTDLSALIERTAQRFRASAGSRSIELTLPQPGACTLISLDPQRIEQIINNLISNALRYTAEDESIRLTLDCTNERARLTIQDHGPGIPLEALDHIFERFYKVDKSRVRSVGGTGLGLSIARKLAQAHGGDLKAANHPEGGAIFTLSLPFDKA
ncbi:MAG: ATP-binding protein [Chloroflexota bacterium]